MDPRGCFRVALAALLVPLLASGEAAAGGDALNTGTEVFDTLGCNTFLTTAERCFVEGVEVLPGIQLQEVGVVGGLSSAQDCQRKCAEYSDCKFFTFRTHAADKTTVCLLKPGPSYATSPFMIVRRYIAADNAYSYVSGPVDCLRRECTEAVDGFYKACRGSTPGSCKAISGGLAEFDPSCIEGQDVQKPMPADCNVQNYKCCRYCHANVCCNQSLEGKLLVAKTFIAGYPTGVESPDHCWGLCVNHRDCTHWNYVESRSTAFVGGACFLHAYNPRNEPLFEDAPSGVTSIIGPSNCTGDSGMNTPNSGFPKDCAKPNLAGRSTLAMWFRAQTAQQCQLGCQKYPGCHFWNFASHQCSFLYDDFTVSATARTALFGPAFCDPAHPPTSNACVLLDTNYYQGQGHMLQETRVDTAAICSNTCAGHGDCAAWTWSPGTRMCQLVGTIVEGLHPVKGDISGHKECVLPDAEMMVPDTVLSQAHTTGWDLTAPTVQDFQLFLRGARTPAANDRRPAVQDGGGLGRAGALRSNQEGPMKGTLVDLGDPTL